MSRADVLHSKVAIVTGAGGGIGLAVAVHLAASGAHVVVNDLDERMAYKTKEAIERAGPDVLWSLEVWRTQRRPKR